ncbi:hypothetical protein RHOSPDRAFT_32925 [Rhodotorula sp. JG-1b]|nr:hypothetical protein RHOSPDRAFT_32925 [Rhodotorula sp. JG-1b]
MRVRPRLAVASRPLARRPYASVMAAWPPQDGQQQPEPYYDYGYGYGYWQQQQPLPAAHYNPAFFWNGRGDGGPFHPSWPAFYPPPGPGLGLGDHRGAAAGPNHGPQQHGHAPDRHNHDNHRRGGGGGGRYSSRRQGRGPPPPHNRNRSPPPPRAAVEEEEQTAAAYGPDGSYIPPSRRQRRDTRHAVVAPPTPTYLAAAANSNTGDVVNSNSEDSEEPIALVMDLNHTLLCRAKRNRQASKMPIVRPYLATFLTYICTPRPTSPKFAPIVYSSARAPNVLSMLAALNLIPPARLAHLNNNNSKHPYEPSSEQGDVLRMVFTREMMGLSERDYAGDVETVKDLGKVWERLGWAGSDDVDGVGDLAAAADEHEDLGGDDGQGPPPPPPPPPPQKTPKLNRKAKARLATRRDTIGARRTLLLDDEAGKAAQQPYSHLPIAPFLLHPSEIPDRAAVTLAPPPPPPPPNPTSTRGTSPPRSGRHSREPPPPPRPAQGGTQQAPPPPPTASASSYDPSAVALEVESHHPPAHDQHLLSTIWILERLSTEPNLAYAIKHGALDRLREEARLAVESRESGPDAEDVAVEEKEVEDEMAENGRRVCEELGIQVSREWVPDWRERLLASSSSSSTKLSHSSAAAAWSQP